jgi:DNA transposition AAA+ family ATPase
MTVEEPRIKGDLPAVRPPKPFDEELRVRLMGALKLSGDTQVIAAKRMGISESELNKYINKKPAGDVADTERRVHSYITDVLRDDLAPQVPTKWIETNVTAMIWGAFDTVCETRDFGLISGPAGCQKSVNEIEYVERNDSAIRIVITGDNCTGAAIYRLILRKLSIRQETRNALRVEGIGTLRSGELVREELNGSGRLIIVDLESGELANSGWRALFDIHNTAKVPVVAVGNASMVEDIKGFKTRALEKNERRTTRVGFNLKLEPYHETRDEAGKLIKREFLFYTDGQLRDFIELHIAEYDEPFFKLCRKIARNPGYLRALHKHLMLFKRVRSDYHDDSTCLIDCNKLLLTETKLEG